MPTYDVAGTDEGTISRLVKTAVSPRPIAWVSSRSEDGVDNLAPFSSYTYVGSSQPVVQFNTSRREDGRLKDSARNAIDTGEFAVNVVTVDLLEPMDETSTAVPPERSEFDLAGVERAACRTIEAPRVADAAVTLECALYDDVEVYDRQVVLGDVTYLHVDESVLTDGRIDARQLATVGRLGGPFYTLADPLAFEMRD